jgi:uncharacterized protein YkwD
MDRRGPRQIGLDRVTRTLVLSREMRKERLQSCAKIEPISGLCSIVPRMQVPPLARRRVAGRRLGVARSLFVATVVAAFALAGSGVAVFAALPTAAAGAPRASGAAHGFQRASALEPQLLAAINDFRQAHGLRPLRLSRGLTLAASRHSVSMVEHGYFEHTSPDGSAFWRRVEATYPRKGKLWSVGENLAWAYPGLSARQTLELWLASPPHRANLLSPVWREVGIGAVRAFAGGVYNGHDVTILTADFGVRH